MTIRLVSLNYYYHQFHFDVKFRYCTSISRRRYWDRAQLIKYSDNFIVINLIINNSCILYIAQIQHVNRFSCEMYFLLL